MKGNLKAVINVKCVCGRLVQMRIQVPDGENSGIRQVPCWTCMREFRAVLFKSRQVSVHKREFMAVEFDAERYTNFSITYLDR